MDFIWRWRGTLLTVSLFAIWFFWPFFPGLALASKSPDGKKWFVVEWDGSGRVIVSEAWPGGRMVPRSVFPVHSVTSLWGAWTPESDGFSRLICAHDDPISITRFSAGDDVVLGKGRTPDFAESDNRMGAAIRAMNPKRAGKTNGDAFAWACSEGNNQFYERYVLSKTNDPVSFETRRGQRVILWP